MSRVLLVAQAPSRSMAADARPFEGARVAPIFAAYCGIPVSEIWSTFDLINLIDRWPGESSPGSKWDAFPRAEALKAAERIHQEIRDNASWLRVVTVGRAATSVFWGRSSERRMPWFEWKDPSVFPIDLPEGALGSCSPHPGGTSMWWNDPANRAAGTAFWRDLANYARGAGDPRPADPGAGVAAAD